MPEIAKGQPVPPGMEDVVSQDSTLTAVLDRFDKPLIGLEYLLELRMEDSQQEPKYLCVLCDKRGDPRSILQHLPSTAHYSRYLQKFFPKLYALIGKLPKSMECKSKVLAVVSHLIAKLEERYGRMKITVTENEAIKDQTHRTHMIMKVESGQHISESPADEDLEEMLTIQYVEHPELLNVKFPLAPKIAPKPQASEKSSVDINKPLGGDKRPQYRSRRKVDDDDDDDVVFVGSSIKNGTKKTPLGIRGSRSRSLSSRRSSRSSGRRSRSPGYKYRRSSRSRDRYRSRSPYYSKSAYHHSRSPHRAPPYYYYHRPGSPPFGPRAHYRSRSRSPERKPYGRRSRSPRRYHSPGKPPHYSHPRYEYRSRGRNSRSRSPVHRISHRSSPYVRRKSPSPVYGTDRAPSPLKPTASSDKKYSGLKVENSSWDTLQQELAVAENEMNVKMDYYKADPEKHPAYEEEWKKFWNKRYLELKSEGKDPVKYDYKPEWILFWKVRMEELFSEELEKQKLEIKEKLGLVKDKERTNDEKVPGETGNNASDEEEEEEGKKNVTVNDIKNTWKALTGSDIKEASDDKLVQQSQEDDDKEERKSVFSISSGSLESLPEAVSKQESRSSISRYRSRSRSRSWSREPFFRGRSRPSAPRHGSRSRSRSRSKSVEFANPATIGYRPKVPKKISFENPLNIITVLRQLSVLEYQLGSFASHVIALLSTGLTMEKNKPQSSVKLLTSENIVFLEMVKEKLKGHLLAGIVPKGLVKTTLFAIKNIEDLLLVLPKGNSEDNIPIPKPPKSTLYQFDGARNNMTAAFGLRQLHPMDSAMRLPPPIFPMPPQLPPSHYRHEYGLHARHYSPPRHGTMRSPPHSPRSPTRSPRRRSRSPRRRSRSPLHSYRSPPRYMPGYLPPFGVLPRDYRRDISPRRRYESSQSIFSARTEANTAGFLERFEKGLAESKSASGIDKIAISRQIAEFLTSQGRMDVSEEELEQLLNCVVSKMQQSASDAADTQETGKKTTDASEREKSTVDSEDTKSKSQIPSIGGENTTTATTSSSSATMSDNLSEKDLINLLRNFKDLVRDEQRGLIAHLRKLERTDPEKVEQLKKYVSGSFDAMAGNVMDEDSAAKSSEDTDDDNYTLDDVYKAASKNIQLNEKKAVTTTTTTTSSSSDVHSGIEINEETRKLLMNLPKFLGGNDDREQNYPKKDLPAAASSMSGGVKPGPDVILETHQSKIASAADSYGNDPVRSYSSSLYSVGAPQRITSLYSTGSYSGSTRDMSAAESAYNRGGLFEGSRLGGTSVDKGIASSAGGAYSRGYTGASSGLGTGSSSTGNFRSGAVAGSAGYSPLSRDNILASAYAPPPPPPPPTQSSAVSGTTGPSLYSRPYEMNYSSPSTSQLPSSQQQQSRYSDSSLYRPRFY